jgi:hypothetical protein
MFMTLDISGNMGTASSVSAAQIVAGSITGSQIAAATIAGSNIINNTITGTQIAASVTISSAVASPSISATTFMQLASHNVIVSSTNAATALKIIRGVVSGAGAVLAGEGFTVSGYSGGQCGITWVTAFASEPAMTVSAYSNGSPPSDTPYINNADTTDAGVFTINGSNVAFQFIAIGPR